MPKHLSRNYAQADPPGPLTCLMWLVLVTFLLGTIVYISLKSGGWI